VPYITPAMEHLKNSIKFLVKVPVLSENMYSICKTRRQEVKQQVNLVTIIYWPNNYQRKPVTGVAEVVDLSKLLIQI
jgi:hypothetical protein